jgi:hypothetical protein
MHHENLIKLAQNNNDNNNRNIFEIQFERVVNTFRFGEFEFESNFRF